MAVQHALAQGNLLIQPSQAHCQLKVRLVERASLSSSLHEMCEFAERLEAQPVVWLLAVRVSSFLHGTNEQQIRP